jgi:hypothetical protein
MINIKTCYCCTDCLVEHKRAAETMSAYFHSVWNESFIHPSKAPFTQQVFLAEIVGGISQLTECKHPARDVVVTNS